MVRPVRVLPLLAVLAAVAVALVAPGRASARVTPLGEYFQVVVLDRISDATFASLAERGAVGLLRPSYGPTTNRRRALAELVRGAEVNARLGLRAAVTAVPAALLVNLALGIGQVSNEVLMCAAVSAGTMLVALGLARVCRSESALLALYGGVIALYALVMVRRPEWQAVNPFGPTQNSRFWGFGNQVETLLLAPLLLGAFLARRRFGLLGFVLFGVFGLVVMTDNRLGADGGGAIVLGIALAVLGMRLFRLGVSGFVGMLASAAVAVPLIVSRGLAQPVPNPEPEPVPSEVPRS